MKQEQLKTRKKVLARINAVNSALNHIAHEHADSKTAPVFDGRRNYMRTLETNFRLLRTLGADLAESIGLSRRSYLSITRNSARKMKAHDQ